MNISICALTTFIKYSIHTQPQNKNKNNKMKKTKNKIKTIN